LGEKRGRAPRKKGNVILLYWQKLTRHSANKQKRGEGGKPLARELWNSIVRAQRGLATCKRIEKKKRKNEGGRLKAIGE